MLSRASLVRLLLGLACAGAIGACAGGCTTAAIVSAGTVAGLAASAVSTGADVYHLGKLDAADEARFGEWIAAVRTTAADLHLTLCKDFDDGRGEWSCELIDDRGSAIDVIIDRRTETLCRTRIDVGLLGSEVTARLILNRIRSHQKPISSGTTRESPVTPATAPATIPP